MSISIKALVTTLLLGSSSAVFAHPGPSKVVERMQVMRGDRGVEHVRAAYKGYDRDRGERDRGDRDHWRKDRDRNVHERGHGRHIDGGWHDRGRDRR